MLYDKYCLDFNYEYSKIWDLINIAQLLFMKRIFVYLCAKKYIFSTVFHQDAEK